ncbi:YciI family protein [Solitalea lacus]|uniref:YciI family protein n=1 Tax=Solitalea lacus TaxID=2911172 RepID=UPI001EDAB276|nr:YciI family protein [Solitalea lacus]UKJ08318.1 YciI family protein [Solitalea lacus]
MKEFMFYIRNSGDAKAALSSEDHLAFVKKCEVYIGKLKSEGKLIAAQPIIREGFVIAKSANNWTKVALDPTKEVQVGYYHILAESMDEAIEIAKLNPEFEYVPSAKIEIHQIKTKEEETSFVYPT